jgi:hypothetical protein
LKDLQAAFDVEAKKYNVYPLDSRFASRIDPAIRPSLTRGRNEFVYYPGLIRIPEGSAPDFKNKSWTIAAEVDMPTGGASGVLATIGGAMAAVHRELAPYLEVAANGKDRFLGTQTKRVGAIMSRSQTSRGLALDPLLTAASKRFLERYCDDHQLHLTQLVSIGPGQGDQSLHRDRGVWSGHVPRSIETQFSTIWAVTAFTRENGATRIVPGSHLSDDERQPNPEEVAHAEMSPGSVLVYSGSVLHGGGTNHTARSRIGLLLHYTLDWLRQEENQYISCPPHVAKDFSPELRALIGYQSVYARGFCTPPLAPGDGAEMVSPESLFRRPTPGWPGLEPGTSRS